MSLMDCIVVFMVGTMGSLFVFVGFRALFRMLSVRWVK
jgi:hypothetical protein